MQVIERVVVKCMQFLTPNDVTSTLCRRFICTLCKIVLLDESFVKWVAFRKAGCVSRMAVNFSLRGLLITPLV